MRSFAFPCLFLGALVGALSSRSSASPQGQTVPTQRLNGPLATTAFSDVTPGYRFDPQSGDIVFSADLEADGRVELFAAPPDASSAARKLNATLPAGGAVGAFELSGGIVVYLADQDVAGRTELYGVHLAVGTPFALSGTFVPGGEVESFLITPNGLDAIYLADALVDGRVEYFRVPIDGSAPPFALDTSPGTNPIRSTRIHPDGSLLLYTRWLPGLLQERLATLALDGSGTEVILAHSGTPLWGEQTTFGDFEITPDGASAVAATSEYLDSDPFESGIFSVPLDASSAPLDLHQRVENWERPFRFSSSTGRVVFQDYLDLVSVNTDGSGRVELTPGGWSAMSTFDLTPDGETVVFQAYTGLTAMTFVSPVDGSQPAFQLGSASGGSQILTDTMLYMSLSDANSFVGLYRQPLSGGPPSLLNGPPSPNSGVINSVALVLTENEEILFVARPASETGRGIYSVPGDGSVVPAHVSPVLESQEFLSSFRLSPDGDSVAYVADRSSPGTFELFPAALTTNPPDQPFLALPQGSVVGDVLGFRVAPNGRGLVYRADQAADGYYQLFRSTLAGAPQLLTSALLVEAEFEYTPTGSHVLFQHPFGELFSTLNAPGSPYVHIDYTNVPTALTLPPDGERVVYDRLMIGLHKLVSVRVDGSNMVTLYNGSVSYFQLSPDGSTVVYLVGQQLSAIPVTGGTAIALTPPGGPSIPASFRISPDSSWVFFRRSQQLWRVPIDGSSAAAIVNAPLAPGGIVIDFAFAPAGTRLVYRATPDGSTKRELYSLTWNAVPSPIQLTAHGAAVQQFFAITADGLRAVYRVDANTPGMRELYSVRLDGGAPPVRISAALLAGGEVHSFALSPNGRRVVYLAAENGADVRELFGVRVQGGPVAALVSLPAFADVDTYRIDPRSQLVFALCDRDTDGVNELFASPLDGSDLPQRVNDPLPPGGAVQNDFVPLTKGRVVFRADQEADEIVELFLGSALFGRANLQAR